MGRSITPADQLLPQPDWDGRVLFRAFGLEYSTRVADGRIYHCERLRDESGQIVVEASFPVDYLVGSGNQGQSWLLYRDGCLLMSPMTYYAARRVWDLSPGYRRHHHHFSRPIKPECLFCHAQAVKHVPDTLNRYEAPVFSGMTIGCERCHGPGELHVQARLQQNDVADPDPTIVNPAKLPPLLRDAVCEQCHLQGQHRISRRGHSPFDYRPGLPFHEFVSVFVRTAELAQDNKFVSSVEQMRSSMCYRGSRGQLGCISCHDAHMVPAAKEKPHYYRQRCLACHESRGCSLPLAVRQKSQDDCVACHMPQLEANIAHTATTDHRVLKNPAQSQPKRPTAPSVSEPLVYFYDFVRDPDDPEIQRDWGIALMEAAERTPEKVQHVLGTLALPRLEQAVRRWPDDHAAREAWAVALWTTGQREAAAAVFEDLLKQAPQKETALANAGTLALEMGRYLRAVSLFQQAVRLNPARAAYYERLARAHVGLGEWHSALYACRKALALDPLQIETRQLLVRILEATDDRAALDRERKILQLLEKGLEERKNLAGEDSAPDM